MKTLKELRTDYGLTQKELGDLFKVSSRTIQNMEKDSTNIKDSLLSKYMSAFNVKYDDIFLGNEYENFVFTNDKKKSIILAFKEKTNILIGGITNEHSRSNEASDGERNKYKERESRCVWDITN